MIKPWKLPLRIFHPAGKVEKNVLSFEIMLDQVRASVLTERMNE